MKLTKFRVTDFRSVEDSGWIEIEEVTGLIGTNESGKTNLLLPLWKLNPAKDGEINLLSDAPRRRYNEFKNLAKKPIFIHAMFELPAGLRKMIAALTGAPESELDVALVTRDFAGGYTVCFPNAAVVRSLPKDDMAAPLTQAREDIEQLALAIKAEEPIKSAMLAAIDDALAGVEEHDEETSIPLLEQIKKELAGVDVSKAPTARCSCRATASSLIPSMPCSPASPSRRRRRAPRRARW